MKYTLLSILTFCLAIFAIPLQAVETVVRAPALPASPFSAPQEGSKGFLVAVSGTFGVASVTVGTPGTLYTAPPTVTFSGGSGTVQATGTTTLTGVGTPTIVAGGTRYTSGDVLTLAGGTGTPTTVTVSAVTGGVITAATLTSGGSYTVIPANPASVTGGSGRNAKITVDHGVGSVVVVTKGNGYATAPTVALGASDGAGTNAAGTSTLNAITTTAKFSKVNPITDSVVSGITFSTTTGAGNYQGDTGIIGKTLKVGTSYYIYGESLTLSSGSALLLLR